jgi:threonine aldolase
MSGSGYIDLRSDTVTRPTPAMRRAMADAEVGDDLFGDDPTVIRLQERAAALTGKQSALYLPTGTLCNQIAMHVFTRSGHAVVCEETAHVGTHELISSALLSGITFRTVNGPHGMVTAAQAAALMFCLSKGLGAPIGSMLAGDAAFIEEARRLRILLGAGWRQAGIMAAAGLIALDEGPKRLVEDHATARRLAEGIAGILPAHIDPDAVQTNIVFVDVAGTGQPPAAWQASLAAEGVLVTIVTGKIRMLTHADVTARDIDTALDAWRRVTAAFGVPSPAAAPGVT